MKSNDLRITGDGAKSLGFIDYKENSAYIAFADGNVAERRDRVGMDLEDGWN